MPQTSLLPPTPLSPLPPAVTAAPLHPAAEPLDEELYSRQIFVLGEAAQRRLQRSRVLLVGLRGVGVEVAKNLILAGVRVLCICDDEPCNAIDLAANFLVKPHHVARGTSRAQACIDGLRELNAHVAVEQCSGALEEPANFDVIVMTDQPHAALQEYCDRAREQGSAVVAAGSFGIYGYVFSDFGPRFEVSDVDGEALASGLVVSASRTSADQVELITAPGVEHGLRAGDYVKVVGFGDAAPRQVLAVRKGGMTVSAVAAKSAGSAPATGSSSSVSWSGSGHFEQVKMPVVMEQHLGFSASVKAPRFVIAAWEDVGREARLHAVLLGLWAFAETHRRLPDPGDEDEADAVLAHVDGGASAEQRDVLRRIVMVANGQLSAVASFIGGVAAQEALKACTHKFTPLNQWLHFACPEVLAPEWPVDLPSAADVEAAEAEDRLLGVALVFGRSLLPRLAELRCFIVGAGALGCELLKNLALMGVASSGGGELVVTDPDSIETSNLNRQFLFRPRHVGLNKARVAALAAHDMNPALHVEAMATKVSPETEAVFGDEFWDRLDVVVNALDNVPARMYVDGRCVYFGKPLLESGTLGTKANTLPVLPHLSESYASDPVKDLDADGPDIPACTLHAYPNLFVHALAWARDAVFEREFVLGPAEARSFCDALAAKRDVDAYVSELRRHPASCLQRLQAVRMVLSAIRPDDHPEALFPYAVDMHASPSFGLDTLVRLARLRFEELFANKIEQLLCVHPPDKQCDGQPFWSGVRRAPSVTAFDASDAAHVRFVTSSARVYARVHGLNAAEVTEPFVKTVLASLERLPRFAPDGEARIPENDAQLKAWAAAEPVAFAAVEAQVQREVDALKRLRLPATLRIEPARFDKDDDDHLDVVWSASVIRARAYKIPPTDRLETKRVVGRIVPAIATTTAAATGLVALELVKLLHRPRILERFRAANFNLAVNSYSFFEPRSCATQSRFGELECNLWTHIELRGDLTVAEVIAIMDAEYDFEVNALWTTGDVTLFNDMFAQDDRRARKVSELFRDVLGREPPVVFIPLTLDGALNSDPDCDVAAPQVRLRWRDV